MDFLIGIVPSPVGQEVLKNKRAYPNFNFQPVSNLEMSHENFFL
jgi:hypothetical protein